MNPLTHNQLVEKAAAWLRKKGCPVVITEMTSSASESPDAIGWRGGVSILVECKVSLADFRADAVKYFRRSPSMGMGCFRYYAAPAGLLNAGMMPEDWGLLEWNGKSLTERVKPRAQPISAVTETKLLISAIRRIAHTAPRGISVSCYTFESKNRATLHTELEPNNITPGLPL